MFEVLFACPKVLARHQAGPAAVERDRYLERCAGQGAARETLLRTARELLVITQRIDVTAGNPVSRSEIDNVAWTWVRQQKRRCRADSGEWSRRLFVQVAVAWLGFLGILENVPHGRRNIFSGQVDDFITHLRDERGCPQVRSTVSGGKLKSSLSTPPRAEPRLRRSPSATSMRFSNRKVGRTGVAYLSRRVRRRCARSSGLPRGGGGALPESQRASTRPGCSNRKDSCV
jgi:hypothetical protein